MFSPSILQPSTCFHGWFFKVSPIRHGPTRPQTQFLHQASLVPGLWTMDWSWPGRLAHWWQGQALPSICVALGACGVMSAGIRCDSATECGWILFLPYDLGFICMFGLVLWKCLWTSFWWTKDDQGKTTFEILWILLKWIEMVWNGLYMFHFLKLHWTFTAIRWQIDADGVYRTRTPPVEATWSHYRIRYQWSKAH